MENDIQNQSEITPEQNICTFPIKKLRETAFPNKSLESSWFCLYLCCKILSLLAVCFCFLFSISRDGNVPKKEKEEKLRHLWVVSRFNWKICLKKWQELDSVCAPHVELTYLCPPGLSPHGNLVVSLLLVVFLISVFRLRWGWRVSYGIIKQWYLLHVCHETL